MEVLLSNNPNSNSTCEHCGAFIPHERSESKFCCSGCEFVRRSIDGLGLTSYYDLLKRENQSAHTANTTPQSFKFMDDERFLTQFTKTTDDGQKEAAFLLDGIHCAACVWLLEKLPTILEGIISARVEFGTGRLNLVFDTNLVKLSEIACLVNSFGYKPTPISDATEKAEQSKRFRRSLYRIGVAAVCSMNIMMLSVSLYQGTSTGIEARYQSLLVWVSVLLSLPVMFYSAVPLYRTAIGGLKAGVLHIDLPIVIAIWAGFITSIVSAFNGESIVYLDSVSAVVLLLLIGRAIQESSIRKVSDLSAALGTVMPQTAIRRGERTPVYALSLKAGEVISISAGEHIAADGAVVSGTGSVDTAVLTGESLPIKISQGSSVFAGTKLVSGTIDVRVDALGSDSRIGRILSSLSSAKRPRITMFLDRCSRAFTLISLLLAAITFILWRQSGMVIALDRTLAVLLVGCPCVLAFATPLAFTISMMRSARAGMFIKSGEAIEKLARIKKIAFDKTGTLTSGSPRVLSMRLICEPKMRSEHEIAAIVNSIQAQIIHPVANALRIWSSSISTSQIEISDRVVHPGKGVSGIMNDEIIRCGSPRWVSEFLQENGSNCSRSSIVDTASVVLTVGDQVQATFDIADEPHPAAGSVVDQFKRLGIDISVISGDKSSAVWELTDKLKIDRKFCYAERTPEEKADIVREMSTLGLTAFVGDGINDALALRTASVGIGIHGSAENVLACADVYLGRGGVSDLPGLIHGSKKTLSTIKRGLAFSLSYNIIAVSGAMLGLVGPLEAAILMPLSSLTVILNASLSRSFR